MSAMPFRAREGDLKHTAKMVSYPCGIVDLIASSSPDFGSSGWEAAEDYSRPKKAHTVTACCDDDGPGERRPGASAEDLERSMRRAKAKLRRLALANDFKYFVTLTLDPSKVDSHDGAAVVKKLNAWASNAVQRHGLRYILVPERHKNGGIHFHGFFNDAFEAVDSGTIRVPWAKKPRKPRSEAERVSWLQAGGRIVYNLPGWSLGFTTAMDLYGDYAAAVAYVCKYIGKDGTKPAGRWYYSGGDLKEPTVTYAELSPAELREQYGERCWIGYFPGRAIAVVNGIRTDVCTRSSTNDNNNVLDQVQAED